MKYVALLRGINVGGRNVIKMADLRSALLSAGYRNVQTYIQSGNVLLDSPLTDIDKLTARIETLLADTFQYEARVVIKSVDGMKKVVAGAPFDWTVREDIRRYVAFIQPLMTREEILTEIHPNPEVDVVAVGPRVIYMTTLMSGLAKSGFTKLISSPLYQYMTIRNWNTTKAILELMTTA